MNWVKCLPIVLMTIRITPDREGLSPFEKVFGRPYRMSQLGRLEEANVEIESSMVEHMRRWFINQTRMSKVLCPAGELQREVAHEIQPGDWIWIQSLKKKKKLEAASVGGTIPSTTGDCLHCENSRKSYLGTCHTL